MIKTVSIAARPWKPARMARRTRARIYICGKPGTMPGAAISAMPLRFLYYEGILSSSSKRFMPINEAGADRAKEGSLVQLERVAFMSYAHQNDKYDRGYLTRFRKRLEEQISALMGEEFTIFQDREHIGLGTEFDSVIMDYLSRSVFLIPILTPHYYNSDWCRKEFELFRAKEQQAPYGQRVFPVYYIECWQIVDGHRFPPDTWQRQLHGYQHVDWRKLRIFKLESVAATKAIHKLAKDMFEAFKKLDSGEQGFGYGSPIHPSGPPTTPSAPRPTSPGPSSTPPEPMSPAGPTTAEYVRHAPFDLMMLPNVTGLLGRSSDIAWVIDLLSLSPRRRHRRLLAALDGAEGIGKTYVATAAVRQLYEHGRFPGGIAVVHCTGVTDPLVVLRDTLTRFDPGRRPPASKDATGLAEEAHRLLATKQALIVLDDVDSRLDVASVITPLQKAGAALLLTSKRPLRVPKAARHTLEPLQKSEALDLLTKPYKRRRPRDDAEHN